MDALRETSQVQIRDETAIAAIWTAVVFPIPFRRTPSIKLQVVATLGVEAEGPCGGNQCGQQGRTGR
jgi:hypothetical protein